jgi:hypothetical protein
MPWTLDKALDDDLVTVIDRHDDMGSYSIRLASLQTIISIELGRFLTSDKTKFIVSHSIHTPEQAGPYRTSVPFGDDPAYALHRAIDGLTSWYKIAVEKGHKPREEWLVRN